MWSFLRSHGHPVMSEHLCVTWSPCVSCSRETRKLDSSQDSGTFELPWSWLCTPCCCVPKPICIPPGDRMKRWPDSLCSLDVAFLNWTVNWPTQGCQAEVMDWVFPDVTYCLNYLDIRQNGPELLSAHRQWELEENALKNILDFAQIGHVFEAI